MKPNQEFVITPLGAAVVEALPDQKWVRQIERDFHEHKICPPSAIFSVAEVEAFYGGAYQAGIPAGVKRKP